MIDSYNFGEIVIEHKKYTSDVIIYPDRVDDSWWRRQGHQLQIEDVQEPLSKNPEVLVVGTGASGCLEVLPQTRAHLKALGIELIAKNTSEACHAYNRLSGSKSVIACLHLTC